MLLGVTRNNNMGNEWYNHSAVLILDCVEKESLRKKKKKLCCCFTNGLHTRSRLLPRPGAHSFVTIVTV